MDEDDERRDDSPPPRKKRFTYKSYERSLKSVHLPSPTLPSIFDEELPDTASHFFTHLQDLRQLSLAPSFVKYADHVERLSGSMAMLLHHWKQITELWVEACLEASKAKDDGEGFKPLFEMLDALTHDLRTTLLPLYPVILKTLSPLLLRKLPPAAFTELLSTLLSLFKFVLLPGLPSPLLLATWKELQRPLKEASDDGRRMLGEVWGAVLRRVKHSEREELVKVMIEDLNKNEALRDGVAWAFVHACQAPSRTLHPCTPTVLSTLLDAHLSLNLPSSESGSSSFSPDPSTSETHRLLKRLLTSFSHHVQTPAQYTPASDVVVGRLEAQVLNAQSITVVADMADEDDVQCALKFEALSRMIEIVEFMALAKNGSRMTHAHLATILHAMSTIPVLALRDQAPNRQVTIQDTYVGLVSAVLAGDMCEMAVWTGEGRTKKVVERAWEVPALGMQLAGSLSDVQWDGWKDIVLPLVLKHVPTALASADPSASASALRLLVVLNTAHRLSSPDVLPSWFAAVGEWAKGCLSTVGAVAGMVNLDEENVTRIIGILAISPLLPSNAVRGGITHILNGILLSPPGENDKKFNETPFNTGAVLGECFVALGKIQANEGEENVTAEEWEDAVIRDWSWNPLVLEGLVMLLKARSSEVPISKPLSSVFAHLKSALLSHDRRLRLGALTILCGPTVQRSNAEDDLLRKCLAAEDVQLDVQGARERMLKIGKVPSAVRDGDEEDVAAGRQLAFCWLIAQLKVNLRPQWSPTVQAISTLSQRFQDGIWALVFTELEKSARGDPVELACERPDWSTLVTGEEGKTEDETERSWGCSSADARTVVIGKWRRSPRESAEAYLVNIQRPRDRLDIRNYEAQLLLVLGEAAFLVEKRSRAFVPHILSLTSTPLARPRLKAYLTLLSKITGPKSLYKTDALQMLYMSLLSSADRSTQLLALTCTLAYKSPALLRHEATLRTLLDEMKWREELTSLDINALEPSGRKEVVNVIVRLLYGLMGDKKGRSRGADRKSAVLGVLSGCDMEELGILVQLMLEPFPTNSSMISDFAFQGTGNSSSGQQGGFLTLLGGALRHLGVHLVPYWPVLLSTTLEILNSVQSQIDSEVDTEVTRSEKNEPEADIEADIDDDLFSEKQSHKSARPLRQLGLKRLADFFRSPASFDFMPYMKVAFASFISPRLPSLDRENTQAPSALLELFVAWTNSVDTVRYLVQFDSALLPKLYQCMVGVNVKTTVVSRVLDVVERLLAMSADDPDVAVTVIQPHVTVLLECLSILVERNSRAQIKADQLAQRQIGILSSLANYISDQAQAARLLALLLPLLRKPAKVVPEKVKADLLQVVRNLLPLIPECTDPTSDVYKCTHDQLSELFKALRGRAARLQLAATFQQLVSVDLVSVKLGEIIVSLNSFSAKRMDEPDFDRRLKAFNELNEELHQTLSTRQWLPILYNMLFFIQDPDELSIRDNAALSLRRFVDALSSESKNQTSECPLQLIFSRTVYPALRTAIRVKTEMVRGEILAVIAYAVVQCPDIKSLQEMQPLLADGDEEANFFNNIHHIQVHRRTRALRRLAEYCGEGRLRNSTLAELFIPLIGHFIMAVGSVDHTLVNEAITTTGHIAGHLAWTSYNGLVQQYLKQAKEKNGSEKVFVRALVAVLDNFHFQIDATIVLSDEEHVETEGDVEGDISAAPTKSLGADAKVADAVSNRLLPSLLSYLEKREVEDTLRIPVSIGIAKVAQHLPEAARRPQIGRLVTILSQILKSKSQETRDLTRDTLSKIAVHLGPAYVPIIIKELRAVLLRGPQLHVLSFVVHSLLVTLTSPEHILVFHTLDNCVADVAHLSAEVVFGQSGKDVQSEDFRTKMREVRGSSSRGLDTFAIVAKFITPPKISSLLQPVRAIMQETEALKTMNKVDDVLRRVATGLNSSTHLTPPDVLILCNTFISQNAKFLRQHARPKPNRKKTDVDVQTKREVETNDDCYANNSFRFVAFGLDLFVTAFRRGRFDFSDPNIISRLEPLVSTIGNTLYLTNVQVVGLGLRAAAAIVKCPLKSIPKSLPVYIRHTMEVIRQAGSTESEVVQIALKSLAVMIRDCPDAQIQEKDLTFLLEVITPDLEEVERQASVFALLRAIVSRKFVVPEIYDMMDKVAEVLVTNQSTQVQELCRSVLLQFLLDYPQGKGRLRNQMTFLAKNLTYVFESGRKSVMELLSAVVTKFTLSLVHEYTDLLFMALIMVLANDESAKCREMGAELIKSLFGRLDGERMQTIVDRLHAWSMQSNQPSLNRVAAQVYGLVVDVASVNVQMYSAVILEDLNRTLERSAVTLQKLEVPEDETDSMDLDIDIEWQLPYQALSSASKMVKASPSITNDPSGLRWDHVVAHSLFPHAWVRLASSRLLGTLFSAVPAARPSLDLSPEHPLSRDGMLDVARKLCIQLRSPNLDEALSLQVVKNLFYAGKCFCLWKIEAVEVTGEVGEEEDVDDEALEDNPNFKRDKGAVQNPLPWLFSKMSYQARSAHIARRNRTTADSAWHHQLLSIFRWFAAMTSHMESEEVEKYLNHILSPVYRILDDDTIRDSNMDEVKTLAQELQTLVQTKVGTTKFSNAHNRIRQGVLGVRRDRKTARVMQTTTNPEASAKRKMQRNVLKKDSRKRKNQAFVEGKIRHGSKRSRTE